MTFRWYIIVKDDWLYILKMPEINQKFQNYDDILHKVRAYRRSPR
jgi:hypothetical protein